MNDIDPTTWRGINESNRKHWIEDATELIRATEKERELHESTFAVLVGIMDGSVSREEAFIQLQQNGWDIGTPGAYYFPSDTAEGGEP